MKKEQLEKLGFRIEYLPSGRINLYNRTQFSINGITAYLCSKGEYQKTMEVNSIPALLAYIKKIELL